VESTIGDYFEIGRIYPADLIAPAPWRARDFQLLLRARSSPDELGGERFHRCDDPLGSPPYRLPFWNRKPGVAGVNSGANRPPCPGLMVGVTDGRPYDE